MNINSTTLNVGDSLCGGDNEGINLLEGQGASLKIMEEPSLSHDDSVDIGFSELCSQHCSDTYKSFQTSLIGQAGSFDEKIRLSLQYAFYIQSQKDKILSRNVRNLAS